MSEFKAGDIVTHIPTGETWVLACDQDGDKVIPAGWPETLANACDCELDEASTESARLEMLEAVSRIGSYRGSLAREQLCKVQHADNL